LDLILPVLELDHQIRSTILNTSTRGHAWYLKQKYFVEPGERGVDAPLTVMDRLVLHKLAVPVRGQTLQADRA
jgi:hypothetical protein